MTHGRFMEVSWRIQSGFMQDSWRIHEGFMEDSPGEEAGRGIRERTCGNRPREEAGIGSRDWNPGEEVGR